MIQGNSGEFKGILRIQGKTRLLATIKGNLEKTHYPALPTSPSSCVLSFFFSLLSFISSAPLICMEDYNFPPCCGQHCKDNKSFIWKIRLSLSPWLPGMQSQWDGKEMNQSVTVSRADPGEGRDSKQTQHHAPRFCLWQNQKREWEKYWISCCMLRLDLW